MIRLTLFHKITIPVVALFLAATVLGTFQVIRMESELLSRQVERSGEIIAKNVANITENAFWTLNWSNVELFLQELVRDFQGDILAVQVVRPNGEIYLADDRQRYGEWIDLEQVTGRTEGAADYVFEKYQERGVLIVHPFSVDQDAWHVLVALSLEKVDDALAAWSWRILGWGFFLTVLVAGLLLYISQAITRPIIALARSAENIAQGNFGQATPVASGDEIGHLAMQFNRMITHLRKAQAQLKASEKRNRTLLESASSAMIGIALVDIVGPRRALFRYVNKALCQLSGYDREEMLGMSINVVMHPDDLGLVWRAFRRKNDGNQVVAPVVARGVRKDGLVVPVEMSTSVTQHEGRAVLSVFIRDISEKVRAEEQIRRYQEQLEQTVLERTRDLQDSLDRLKKTQSQLLHSEKLASIGQLAAGIAHEINTPAQFIGDNAQFLRQANKDFARFFSEDREFLTALRNHHADIAASLERLRQEADVDFLLRETPLAIEQILDGVERISRIVGSMREFAHPGTREKTPMDLNRALENTVTVARNEWKYNADLEMDLDPDLPMVSCLPNEINQVFLNVLVNASQAIHEKTPERDGAKGRITISTRRRDDAAEVRIADTGAGIPEDVQARIFDPFFTTKEVGRGTGQGLAIAYAVVVEKHQGEICFETRQGEGTTFIIRLPIDG